MIESKNVCVDKDITDDLEKRLGYKIDDEAIKVIPVNFRFFDGDLNIETHIIPFAEVKEFDFYNKVLLKNQWKNPSLIVECFGVPLYSCILKEFVLDLITKNKDLDVIQYLINIPSFREQVGIYE